MKGYDNCSQNKILKIISHIYYRALSFGKIEITCSLIKHCFSSFYKNKFIIIIFILQYADKK